MTDNTEDTDNKHYQSSKTGRKIRYRRNEDAGKWERAFWAFLEAVSFGYLSR